MRINHRNSCFQIIVSLTLWFWECSEAAGRICFTKEVLFEILQRKPLVSFLIKLTVFSCAFFEIIKGTFFMKHLWRLLRRLEKSPWLLVENIIFSALWVFSFWLIAFSWTLPLNVGILSSNFLLKSGGTH